LSARMKFMLQSYRLDLLLGRESFEHFSLKEVLFQTTFEYHESSNDKHFFQSRNICKQMVGV
jgi:hypothetical protein